MARGKDDFADAYVDEKIGVSDYPLSASVACGKVRLAIVLNRENASPDMHVGSSLSVQWKNSGTLFDTPTLLCTMAAVHPVPICVSILPLHFNSQRCCRIFSQKPSFLR